MDFSMVLRRPVRIDSAELEANTRDLLRAVGLLAETDDELLFREAATLDPDARTLSAGFLALSVAPDPLSLLTNAPELRGPLRAIARAWGSAHLIPALRAGSVGHAPRPWSQLSPKDQQAIRSLAGHLARYQRSLVPVSRPRQAAIDTALFGLAEIFARHEGFTGDVLDLPHTPGSRFIGFCRSVLFEHVHPAHCSRTALARRWQRVKVLHREGLPPGSPGRRTSVRRPRRRKQTIA